MQGTFTRLTALFLLLLGLGGVIQAGKLFSRDLLFDRIETELGFWGRGDYHPEVATIERTEQDLGRLLAAAPANPQYLALQANYAAWRSFWAADFVEAQQFSRQAVAALYAALQSRPAHRHSWTKMVRYASQVQDGKPMRLVAQARLEMLSLATDTN